ncbi:MAG: hypothetical protein QOH47_2426 [Sphingomonadales bacterium]|jgi:hypothetical protein|nr:hypothetical protein [Sphingomonadales bacterium]
MHVFIAIPSDGTVEAWFAQSLAAMVAKTLTDGVEIAGKRVVPRLTTKVEIGKLPMVRNRLLQLGIASGADYMLWLDSDHVFPEWALVRLLMVDRDVVGINQPTRSRPHLPTARGMDGERIYAPEQFAEEGRVAQALQIGFPMVLMRMSIIGRLEAQATKEGRRSIYPMFDFALTDDLDVAGSEDTFFCRRLFEAGIPIHLDHTLSWATRHIAPVAVGMAEALADRPAAAETKSKA